MSEVQPVRERDIISIAGRPGLFLVHAVVDAIASRGLNIGKRYLMITADLIGSDDVRVTIVQRDFADGALFVNAADVTIVHPFGCPDPRFGEGTEKLFVVSSKDYFDPTQEYHALHRTYVGAVNRVQALIAYDRTVRPQDCSADPVFDTADPSTWVAGDREYRVVESFVGH